MAVTSRAARQAAVAAAEEEKKKAEEEEEEEEEVSLHRSGGRYIAPERPIDSTHRLLPSQKEVARYYCFFVFRLVKSLKISVIKSFSTILCKIQAQGFV